jgi:hypothetical protein
VAAAGYVGLVTGACPFDLGIGRRVRPLGPQLVDMAAPRRRASWDVGAKAPTSRPQPPADSRDRRPFEEILVGWRSAVDFGEACSSKRYRSHTQAKEATWPST